MKGPFSPLLPIQKVSPTVDCINISDRILYEMNEIRRLRRTVGVTQAALADAAGTSQPTIAAYETGRKSPRLGTVRRLAESVGLAMSVQFHRPLTREDRRSIWLHRSITLRLKERPRWVLQQARKTLKKMRHANPGARQLLDEWGVLLKRSIPELIPLLTDPGARARELRQVTPFAGVLSAEERAREYRDFAEEERKRRAP
jgi:transcriptional regulator with XRE-family HTH domain